MTMNGNENIASAILKTALDSGADLAGFVSVASVKQTPTHKLLTRLSIYEVIDFSESDTAVAPEEFPTSKCGIELPTGPHGHAGTGRRPDGVGPVNL